MDRDILDEQIAYYRARAIEYDRSIDAASEFKGAFARAHQLLKERAMCEHVLELACGTGIWTQTLLTIGQQITAIDVSPEMLELARHKTGEGRVQYQQANLFEWEPEREYDLVFFANWLSHVPPRAFEAFLHKVSRAVRQGGSVVIVDQYAPTAEDQQMIQEGKEGKVYARRSVETSGETFTIVKAFYDGQRVEAAFSAPGFATSLQRLDENYFYFEVRRR
jgi:demethylmenaquinone methyltransferase/2-methoxy-6-polyprenyl-1,4-benzoquinol methylase